jgi:hypothetical protein
MPIRGPVVEYLPPPTEIVLMKEQHEPVHAIKVGIDKEVGNLIPG